MQRIRLWGAERQAALSLALCYPETGFEFISDRLAVDGYDLPNVVVSRAQPVAAGSDGIVVCPRWLPETLRRRFSLAQVFARLADRGITSLLPLSASPGPTGEFLVKGDAFHRPDQTLSGTAHSLGAVTDPNGCGLVFQPAVKVQMAFMVTGRRASAQDLSLGVFKILAERFFQLDIIQAAETVAHPALSKGTREVLDALDYTGYFSLTWLSSADRLLLSSFRPVPSAGVATLKRAGVDLLAPPRGVKVAEPGRRFVAYPHYAAYRGSVA